MKPYYSQGGIEIYHGDCRDVLPTLQRDGVGIVTDPPYGCAYATNRIVRGVGATWLNTSIANDDDTSVRDEMLEWVGNLPAIVFGTWKRPKPKNTRAVLIWDKGPASGMGDLSMPWKPSWEEIYIIGDGFSGRRDEGVLKGYTVVTWESLGRAHPNEKPVSLLQALIQKVSADTIIDPFMGSGTTLRAAKNLGRRAIGIEIEERYCDIAARRLQQEVMELAS